MKQFKEIFGEVMIKAPLADVTMMGADVPVVTLNASTWVEFVTWANKAFSPNLKLSYARFNSVMDCVSAKVEGALNEKSISTLKANDIKEFSITADEGFDEDGMPCGCVLWLNIPCIPDV